MIKQFTHNNRLIALVIKKDFHKDGINFFTENSSTFQVANMSHKKETVVKAHVHNVVNRTISITQEVLILKKGSMRVDLYSDNKEYIESFIAQAGDIVFLPSGGHGIKCLSDIEMVEVKQGPYLGEQDKVRFEEISDEKVIIND